MENGWSQLHNNSSTSSYGERAQNNNQNNCTNHAWDVLEYWDYTHNPPSKYDWHTSKRSVSAVTAASASTAATAQFNNKTTRPEPEESAMQGLMFSQGDGFVPPAPCSSLYGGGGGVGSGSHYHPDPHLVCLNLGKRHYFEDAVVDVSITKKSKPFNHNGIDVMLGPSPPASAAAMPRCQVDGCRLLLLNAKDYHKRHKVCEMHAKAPIVLVLGLEQRFCQQCSRFHAVSEFDDSKRSCRRRLAGHNERRRKSSQDHQAASLRNTSQDFRLKPSSKCEYLKPNDMRALSLLSSKIDTQNSSAELPERCSAALRELIAEHRAAVSARQLSLDRELHHQPVEEYLSSMHKGPYSFSSYQNRMVPESHSWERMKDAAGASVTLELMQTPSSAFGFLSMRGEI